MDASISPKQYGTYFSTVPVFFWFLRLLLSQFIFWLKETADKRSPPLFWISWPGREVLFAWTASGVPAGWGQGRKGEHPPISCWNHRKPTVSSPLCGVGQGGWEGWEDEWPARSNPNLKTTVYVKPMLPSGPAQQKQPVCIQGTELKGSRCGNEDAKQSWHLPRPQSQAAAKVRVNPELATLKSLYFPAEAEMGVKEEGV